MLIQFTEGTGGGQCFNSYNYMKLLYRVRALVHWLFWLALCIFLSEGAKKWLWDLLHAKHTIYYRAMMPLLDYIKIPTSLCMKRNSSNLCASYFVQNCSAGRYPPPPDPQPKQPPPPREMLNRDKNGILVSPNTAILSTSPPRQSLTL